MKIPVEIIKIKEPDGVSRLRAVVSLQDAITNSARSQEFVQIQNEYVKFIENLKKQLLKIKSGRKYMSNPKLQWELANTIYALVKFIENDNYIFTNMSEALSRDVGLSKSQLNYLRKFRRYYPTIGQVKEQINWSKYREILDISNKEIRKICEDKVISGELKTDSDIREFKATYRKRTA